DEISVVSLSSEGAAVDAAPGSYAIVIGDAQGSGVNNYLITYADAPESFNVENPLADASDLLASIIGGNNGNGQGQGQSQGQGGGPNPPLNSGLEQAQSAVTDAMNDFANGNG